MVCFLTSYSSKWQSGKDAKYTRNYQLHLTANNITIEGTPTHANYIRRSIFSDRFIEWNRKLEKKRKTGIFLTIFDGNHETWRLVRNREPHQWLNREHWQVWICWCRAKAKVFYKFFKRLHFDWKTMVTFIPMYYIQSSVKWHESISDSTKHPNLVDRNQKRLCEISVLNETESWRKREELGD